MVQYGINGKTSGATPTDVNTREQEEMKEEVEDNLVLIQLHLITQVLQNRTGVRTRLVSAEMREELGDRVVSMNILPFIRNRSISFSATRMKPNTRVFPFFDNVDISTYITPSGGSLGGNLVTDSNGAVSGTFALPDPTVASNPRWRSGRRVFRLTSSSTDSRTIEDVETAARRLYRKRYFR